MSVGLLFFFALGAKWKQVCFWGSLSPSFTLLLLLLPPTTTQESALLPVAVYFRLFWRGEKESQGGEFVLRSLSRQQPTGAVMPLHLFSSPPLLTLFLSLPRGIYSARDSSKNSTFEKDVQTCIPCPYDSTTKKIWMWKVCGEFFSVELAFHTLPGRWVVLFFSF